MDDVNLDTDTADYGGVKRSNRAKKRKKFFDDEVGEASLRPTIKVKLKASKVKEQWSELIEVVEIEALEETESVKQEQPVDDEEAWLDALEKGELDDNGEIPKAKDPSLMTARQRALLDRGCSVNLVEDVTIVPKEELSEEAKKKREEKNRRRKLQAVKRAEENKKQTIERLVQSSKLNKDQSKNARLSALQNIPMVKYISSSTSTTLSFPEGFDYPLKAQKVKEPAARKTCSQCGNQRKYDCSRTGAALCSLQCYKKNLTQFELTPGVS